MRFFEDTGYTFRAIAVSLMAILAVGCKGPKEIPDEDLVKIFHDCFLANAYYNEEGDGADSLNIYEPIFERYGYTTADIRHTVKTFSQRKSAMLSDLVTAASELLEEEYRAEQYKVVILDTIDRVAQRTLTRIVYSDTLIRVNTLRDTSKLRIRIDDIVPGDYTIRFEYLIDSLDENRNSRAEIHTLLSDSTESLRQTTMLSRRRDSKYTRKISLDSIHKVLCLDMYYHPKNEESKLPDITIRNLEVERVLPVETSVDSLYRMQLNLRIFNHALMMGFTADTLPSQEPQPIECHEKKDSVALRTN